MRSLLLVVALAVPAAVSAQSLTIQVQQQDRVSIGPDNCGASLPADYTLALLISPCSDLKIWLTAADCEETPATGDLVLRTVARLDVPSNTTGNFVVPVADLPIFDPADGGQACGAAQVEETYKICGAVKYQDSFGQCNGLTLQESTPPTVHFDSIPPAIPIITRVDSLDSALGVAVTLDEDTNRVTVNARLPGSSEVVASAERVTPASVVRVEGLTNGTQYEVVAIARDEAGNVSAESEPSVGTPVAIAGFGHVYKGMGGAEEGGCSAVGATLAGLWSLVVATWFLSRRRSWR